MSIFHVHQVLFFFSVNYWIQVYKHFRFKKGTTSVNLFVDYER